MGNHKDETIQLEQAIEQMFPLQEKLFELDPKHRLVSYREFSDEEQSRVCRTNLISSFCANNSRPLVDRDDLQEAAHGYLRALRERLTTLGYVEPDTSEIPDT